MRTGPCTRMRWPLARRKALEAEEGVKERTNKCNQLQSDISALKERLAQLEHTSSAIERREEEHQAIIDKAHSAEKDFWETQRHQLQSNYDRLSNA